MLIGVYNDIKADGGAITITYTTKPTLNTITEELTAGTSSTFETYGVKDSFEFDDIDGENIKVGDTKMLIPAYGFTFDFENVFRFCTVTDNSSSKVWKVLSLYITKPGDTAFLFTAHLRG